MFEKVKEVILDTLSCEPEQITMEASLVDDLEADSLDAVELNLALNDVLGFSLTDEIAAYIAAKITANVRQLEGTVKKIKAFRDLEGSDVDKPTVDRAIQDMSKSNEFIVTADTITKEICRYFRLEEDQIKGQSRSRDCVNARQIAMYLIRRMTSLSLSDTGLEFGGRDHTTVLHSIEQVEKKMKKDPAFNETVRAIITNINSKK